MAIKAAVAAALLMALVAVVSATTYTTTVTTTSYDERGSQKYQQCSQKVQGREFRACQSFLKQRSYLEMDSGSKQEYVEQCCEQLRDMDQYQCGCEAIKQAVQKAQQQGGSSYQTGQSEKIYERARALPRLCRLSDQQCHFNLVFV
ncbi:2S seed storage protein-like [Salvia divinorum]|uniref:2S seed storage protein-like n=1 Tax=Salvia divinorum TaxID=28513 RepID=A0ABD1GPQ5_SALDI